MTKNVLTIPSGMDFIDALAEGLWRESKDNLFCLADLQVYLPTRRACLSLRDAFLNRLEDRAALLPRMRPLGDIDEDEFYFADTALDADLPPALSPLRRKLLLTQLVRKRDTAMSYDQAAQLADALAKFLDEVQINRLDFSKLGHVVEKQELAEHWQQTVQFLEILVTAWPKMLAEEGCIDPVERRNRAMAMQIAAWQKTPPKFPILAAGSTGSVPATADFLDAIASLPNGRVVLPGLDVSLDEESWQAVDDNHPQHAMKHLLSVFGVEKEDVRVWGSASASGNDYKTKLTPERDNSPPRREMGIPTSPAETCFPAFHASRHRLLQETMRPAKVTEAWRHLKPNDIPRDALVGLSRLTCDHPQEEAQAIALMLRTALETPEKTAALVTPDRGLAERVACLLSRWGIEANDSGGASLATRPVGMFLIEVLNAADPDAGAVDWLSLLKHPFAAFGINPAECRTRARQLEIRTWRTDRPEDSEWLAQLRQVMKPLTDNWRTERTFEELLDAHIALAERIAATDKESGAMRLWSNDDGEQAAEWLAELRLAARGFPPLSGTEYAPLLMELLCAVTYRPRYGAHPRLSILGLLEARLTQADLVILGGLNEGVWPPEIPADPWMSRPMRKTFGLPAPEYRIGLAAHDFMQLASAPEVILTRSRRAGNSPTVPSRFLLQLEAVLRALGYADKETDALAPEQPWQEWATRLDEPPAVEIKPCPSPSPKPPANARPRELSVTDISAWRRNPYAIYAKHILKLRKLNPLDAALDARDRGSLIHEALDRFAKKCPDDLPPTALDDLLAIGRTLFAAHDEHPEVQAFWWPRFEAIAVWFIAQEHQRRAEGARLLQSEAKGRIALGDFILKGRADRVDRLADGSLAIIDYKTGGAPTDKDVAQGVEPQLSLLALIAAEGGFDSIPAAPTSELWYWKLSGKHDDPADDHRVKGDVGILVEQAASGLKDLIAKFADPATPYEAAPKPGLAPRYDDYAHLARLREWGRTERE